MSLLVQRFKDPWLVVPSVWLDCETTGIRAGYDAAVQFGLARFDDGKFSEMQTWLVNPCVPIGAEAQAVHGITEEMVREAIPIEVLFDENADLKRLLVDAQPGAYNAPFDRHFVPPFGKEWTWPWLDSLSLVRHVDKFVSGKGRHKLEVTAARHGVELAKAHDAGADARAAGELFYKLAPRIFNPTCPLGDVIHWMKRAEADQWHQFNEWRSRQPPKEKEASQ